MTPVRALIALGAVAAVTTVGVARGAADTPAQATCATGGEGALKLRSTDVVLGPLVLIGARQTTGHRPDAFGRAGYKVPATLAEGTTATLSVPSELRGRVGFVFTRDAQDQVFDRGLRGADTAVRFTACPRSSKPGRTGWPGGFVVDRPRCATLLLSVPGRRPVRRRVPLGRRCPPHGQRLMPSP